MCEGLNYNVMYIFLVIILLLHCLGKDNLLILYQSTKFPCNNICDYDMYKAMSSGSIWNITIL